jgi:hypothetical protein
MSQVQTAVNALNGATELPKAIQDLGHQTKRMEDLTGTLMTEYQMLLERLEVQREVSIRLCSALSHSPPIIPLEQWRQREESIREQVIRERGEGKK